MHLRRQEANIRWPITRKGTAYVVRTVCDPRKSIPLLLVMREMLKAVRTNKELKKILNRKEVLLNQRPVFDEKAVVSIFDVITIVPAKENYRLNINNKGKFIVEKIAEKDSGEKITKVTSKKLLNNKKIQINCFDGINIVTSEKMNTNDSIVIDLKTRKILKVLPLKEGSKVEIIKGKHIGEIGKVEKVGEMIEVKFDGGKTTIPKNTVIVID